MKSLLASLKSIYPHVQYDGKMPIYDDAYIKNSKKGKNRYWARTILQNMWDKHGDYKKRLRDKDGYLIITNTEICDRKISGDHAVFGWSFRAVRLSVVSYRHFVSTNRCTDKDLLKIVMHELGHSYGGLLPGAPELRGHCPNLKCLMRDAKDKYPYTKINKFCASCDRVMKEKGFDTKCMQKLLN
jgi:predicted Zn-dependent protease